MTLVMLSLLFSTSSIVSGKINLYDVRESIMKKKKKERTNQSNKKKME
jgi:hypothetical protein